jgi:AcrR family transcriptional regulator
MPRHQGSVMRTVAAAADQSALLPGEVGRPMDPTARSDRRAEIVQAARRILESEGADALTMRRLAGQLGMQAPSLYKHFPNKAAVERALIEDAFFDMGDITHTALHAPGLDTALERLTTAYRLHALQHPNLYRLATAGPLDRDGLPEGLENWAGNPWFVVSGDSTLAQALWSFAHGMVILELDDRYPPGSDLDQTWRAGAAAFLRMSSELAAVAEGAVQGQGG